MGFLSEEDKKIITYSNNPVAFIKDILGLEVQWFHKEWIELFEHNDNVALLAPRGHGKSTIVASYILWCILRDPTVRILQVTINQDKANEMMSFIQSNLVGNQKILDIWGEQRNPNEWSKSTIRVINRGGHGTAHKEPTFQVLGVTSSMVGSHYDMIILDDITDAKNSRTEYRRRELVDWYNRTLLPMRDDSKNFVTKIISIGTKWHEDDIHAYFQKLDAYKTRTYKAIIYDPSEKEIDEGKKPQVLWPDKYSYQKLMDIKAQAGTVGFAMQYQNEVISAEDAPIKWEWIERAQRGFTTLEPPYQVYMGVDFASRGEDSDYFSISIIAIKDGCVYLMDGYRGKLLMNEQFNMIKEYEERWWPIKIGIDSAAQQKMITEQLEFDNPSLPIIPIKSSFVNDKMSRVMRLSVLFETNRIFMKPDLTAYADELSMFPRGSHDDTIDSLGYALQAAKFEEDKKHIDWGRMPNLIHTKPSTGPHVTKRKSYNVIKV